jgi:multidrug efflux pump subunit AcrA (membrane-fusion protein)
MQINWRKLPKIYLLGGGAILLLIIGLVVGAIHPYKHVMGSQPVTLPDVEVLQVQQQDVPIYGEFIGTLDGLVNADVRAQVTGYLLKQGYEEGRFVKQGQLLFQIDPRPFQAALDQAQGQLTQAKQCWPTHRRCNAAQNSMWNATQPS